jgi:hypothetical protein
MKFGETKIWMVHSELKSTTRKRWLKAWRIARKIYARSPIDEDGYKRPDLDTMCRYNGLLGYAINRLEQRNFQVDPIVASPESNLIATKIVNGIIEI